MIIITGSNSKKFGDICYVFVVFIINVNDYMIDFMITCMDEPYFFSSFFLLTLYNDLLILVCVYLLVGSRIIVILIDPNCDSRKSGGENLRKCVAMNLSSMLRSTKDEDNVSSGNQKLNSRGPDSVKCYSVSIA